MHLTGVHLLDKPASALLYSRVMNARPTIVPSGVSHAFRFFRVAEMKIEMKG